MKLSDFNLLDNAGRAELQRTVAAFNQTYSAYPRDKTVHQVFSEQAARAPHAVAVVYGEQCLTYADLERQSNQLARFLAATGLVERETFVGLMMDRSLKMVVALLGILKVGAAYVPLETDLPFQRVKYMLLDTCAPLLISEKGSIRKVNKLQWECPDLRAILCIDSNDVHAEPEELSGMMDPQVWDYIAQEAFDDISGGGWKSSYSGEWLSREVMDEYSENIRAKLAPYLDSSSRVLEIGCASGISMFRLAPLVGRYHGTDLSAGIVDWAAREAQQRGLENIRLQCLPAHAIDQVPARDFDVIILNSVIECFSGHNYLLDVLRKAIDLLGETGLLFLGNVWDQDQKDAFVQSLREFKRQNPGRGYQTKIDRYEELFVSRAFFEDLRHDLPEIVAVEFSQMLGTAESELSVYGYDALLRIDKRGRSAPEPAVVQPRHKYQYDRRALGAQADTPLAARSAPDSLAYLMYTSGTTGLPKGVMVEHRSILRLVLNTNFVRLSESDCILQTGALAFDASTFEIWSALLNGCCLCLAPKDVLLDPRQVGRLITRQGITTMWLTSSLFNHLVEADIEIFNGLSTLLVGGEKLSAQHINRLRERYPALKVINGYGPTENTTFTTCFGIDRPFERDIPIGSPVANTTVYILDDQMQLAAVGVPGKLCTGGDGLARGYLNDAALTATRFVTLPAAVLGAARPTRIYLTGDLARWLPDGNVEFLGRSDNQLKIRGYRVEPEEIENQLRQQVPGAQAVVLARDFGRELELVAYVTGSPELNFDDLRESLQRVLPDYMVPAYFVRLDQLPLNQNGKVDRQALPDPQSARRTSGDNYTGPETETEELLVEIWEEVLEQQNVGVEDNFFDAGGHSLKVTKLVSLIHKRLGVETPLATVFNAPTVRQLAQCLMQAARFGVDIADQPMVRLQAQTAGPAIFAFPPGTGDVLGYIQLAQLLEPYMFYGFNFISAETRLHQYADLIASVQPEGSCVLFGYSSGGNLAFHVARELEARGRCVSDIVMVDSARRHRKYRHSPEEALRVGVDFLNHESIRPYLNTPVLRDKVLRQVQNNFVYISNLVDSHTVKANIHVLLSVEALGAFVDDSGTEIASVFAWDAATSGTFQTHQGCGEHNNMLYPPCLAANATKLLDILAAANAQP